VGGPANLGRILRLPAVAQERLADARRIGNFLRGRLAFRPRADDIYVVSYPRSGTTWMQFMLVHLVAREEPQFSHLSQASPWFERSLALGSLRAADFERWPSPRVFKSHLAHGWLPRSGRYIYVWRDAADVAVSYFHFYRSHLGFEGDFPTFFRRFLAGDLQYRSWSRHVEGWLAQAGDPHTLIVRYEDLQADRAAALDRLAGFLGLSLAPERRDRILTTTTFEAMKRREAEFDHVSASIPGRPRASQAFIRAGKVGQGAATLTAEQKAELDRAWQTARARRPVRDLGLAAFLH